MAEPVRRRIVDILASGEHTSGQLADVIGSEFRISRTAVSKHLRVLRDAGFSAVRADRNFRWWRLTTAGVERLELAVADVRMKTDSGMGWDAENHGEHDPLRGMRVETVRRRGPGRLHPRGRRGRQRSLYRAADPDAGLYPGYAPPQDPSLDG